MNSKGMVQSTDEVHLCFPARQSECVCVIVCVCVCVCVSVCVRERLCVSVCMRARMCVSNEDNFVISVCMCVFSFPFVGYSFLSAVTACVAKGVYHQLFSLRKHQKPHILPPLPSQVTD